MASVDRLVSPVVPVARIITSPQHLGQPSRVYLSSSSMVGRLCLPHEPQSSTRCMTLGELC
jgi:hypothetical protein